MLENISLSFQSVWAHKIRSFLTMLGIIIGIASIITIVSTIKGTNEQIKKNLIGSGVNAVVVSLYQDDYEYDLQYQENPDGVRQADRQTLEDLKQIERVSGVAAFHKRSYAENVYYLNAAFSGSVYGVDQAYFSLYGLTVSAGRGFTDDDYENYRKVAVVDTQVAGSLFGGKSPVGETLEFNGEPFTVVGVVTEKQSFSPVINSLSDYYTYMQSDGGRIYLPDSAWPVAFRFDEPQSFAVGTPQTDDMTYVGQKAAEYLSGALVSNGDYAYRAADLLQQAKQLQELSSSTNRQLVWIAGISLIVGGIGVMNIMLVTVSERTREIGLKKAIGAKKQRILRQFLTEAAVLTSLGGVIGVLAGILLAKLLSLFMQTPSAVSIPAILVAVAFSTVIGVVFGLIPAVKAANLNPIDALRRE
ncbi:MAG: ABC transporter permease [Clostridia bacterium]|nr:ABC transporter permease [Clostridia bacterium]